MANTNNDNWTNIDWSKVPDAGGMTGKPNLLINGDAINQPVNIQQPVVMKNPDLLTAEDKFYEKLGIKYHDSHMFGVYSRTKGRFYLVIALVIGYFAYKKFKK
jgi:hypothetical protein